MPAQNHTIGTLGLIADGIDHEKTMTTPDAISIQKIFTWSQEKSFSFSNGGFLACFRPK